VCVCFPSPPYLSQSQGMPLPIHHLYKHSQAPTSSRSLAGIMLYGTGYWGVTEANYFVVLGHFLSAAFGAKLWQGEYRHVLGWELPGGVALRRGDIALLMVLGGGVQQSFGCIYRTLESKVPPPPLQVAGCRYAALCKMICEVCLLSGH